MDVRHTIDEFSVKQAVCRQLGAVGRGIMLGAESVLVLAMASKELLSRPAKHSTLLFSELAFLLVLDKTLLFVYETLLLLDVLE